MVDIVFIEYINVPIEIVPLLVIWLLKSLISLLNVPAPPNTPPVFIIKLAVVVLAIFTVLADAILKVPEIVKRLFIVNPDCAVMLAPEFIVRL